MTIVSLSMLAALIVSMIANVALTSRLKAAKKREEEWKRGQFW